MYNSKMLRHSTCILQSENKLTLYYSASSYTPYFLYYSWAIKINKQNLRRKKAKIAETSLQLASKNSAISVKFHQLEQAK